MKNIMASVVSLFAIATLQLPAGAQQKFDTKELSFTFPGGFGPMKEKSSPIDTKKGKMPNTMYEVTDPKGECLILSKSTLSVDASDPHMALAAARDAVINQLHAKLEKDTFFTYDHCPAISFYLNLQLEKKPWFHREQVVIKKNHLYQIILLCLDSSMRDSANIEGSFKSLKIK